MADSERTITCCTTAAQLRELISSAPAAVVQIRALSLPSMFPSALADATAKVPYPVVCAVAPPEALQPLPGGAAMVPPPVLGEALVFSRGCLVGRLDATEIFPAFTLVGLLRAGLSPWVGRPGAQQWDDDDCDPFTTIGVSPGATFEDVRAAWRERLAEYHPDRFATAGDKIKQLALSESQRLNAAFREIRRRARR